jgi:hypothetical protein
MLRSRSHVDIDHLLPDTAAVKGAEVKHDVIRLKRTPPVALCGETRGNSAKSSPVRGLVRRNAMRLRLDHEDRAPLSWTNERADTLFVCE